MVNQSVSYGPYSTPSSIAASIAALVTRNYYQYGISARAFGANVIYNGNTTLGTVSSVPTGSSFGTSPSSAAGTAAENACESAPPPQPAPTRVTIVGWINGSAITLPTGEGSLIEAAFPRSGLPPINPIIAIYTDPLSFARYLACTTQTGALAINQLGVVSTANDKAYASAWLLKYTGNFDPGRVIDPVAFKSQTNNFRIFNDFSAGQVIPNTAVGNTLDPCGSGAGFSGEQNPLFDGYIGTSTRGYRYQLAEVRVDPAGQRGFKTLTGHDIPWVWSVIEFDQRGNPVGLQNNDPTCSYPAGNYQIFPTYSVYENGSRVYTTCQGTPAAFANLPSGMELFPGSIR